MSPSLMHLVQLFCFCKPSKSQMHQAGCHYQSLLNEDPLCSSARSWIAEQWLLLQLLTPFCLPSNGLIWDWKISQCTLSTAILLFNLNVSMHSTGSSFLNSTLVLRKTRFQNFGQACTGIPSAKGASVHFLALSHSPLPSIALSVHCLSWSAIFSLSLSSTLVQDYIALMEYSAQSNSLCTTLKCTVGPSVSLSHSLANGRTEAQGLLAAPSLSRLFNWGQSTVNSVKPSLQKQSL